MNRRMILASLFWALSVGGIVAILAGESQAVSLRIWLAAFAIWFALATMGHLFKGTPLLPSPMRGVFTRRPEAAAQTTPRVRDVRALEGLLVRAGQNDRAFVQQLRPRLATLADHYLLLHHGIDRRAQPARAAQVLGDVGWLLDPNLIERAPTLAELDTFIQLLVSPSGSGAKEPA